MANVESVEPNMNMVMNKPDEDTLEEVPQSPQQSPPSVQWNTPPHIQVAAMLVKVKEIESKLSSLTLNKLDLMTFLEELTTDLSLLKHKLQLPYKGHKFAITTPPIEPSDEEDIPDLVSLSEDEIEKDYVQLPFGSYFHQNNSTLNLISKFTYNFSFLLLSITRICINYHNAALKLVHQVSYTSYLHIISILLIDKFSLLICLMIVIIFLMGH